MRRQYFYHCVYRLASLLSGQVELFRSRAPGRTTTRRSRRRSIFRLDGPFAVIIARCRSWPLIASRAETRLAMRQLSPLVIMPRELFALERARMQAGFLRRAHAFEAFGF